jgi:hypothetical protein
MTELVKGHGWLVPPFAKNIKCPNCNDTLALLSSIQEMLCSMEGRLETKELVGLQKQVKTLRRKAKKGTFSYGAGALQFTHLMSLYAIPDEWKAAEAIEDAYNHPKRKQYYGRKSREFAAAGFDFKRNVVPMWVDLLNEVQSELGMFGNYDGKDNAFEDVFKEITANSDGNAIKAPNGDFNNGSDAN